MHLFGTTTMQCCWLQLLAPLHVKEPANTCFGPNDSYFFFCTSWDNDFDVFAIACDIIRARSTRLSRSLSNHMLPLFRYVPNEYYNRLQLFVYIWFFPRIDEHDFSYLADTTIDRETRYCVDTIRVMSFYSYFIVLYYF